MASEARMPLLYADSDSKLHAQKAVKSMVWVPLDSWQSLEGSHDLKTWETVAPSLNAVAAKWRAGVGGGEFSVH